MNTIQYKLSPIPRYGHHMTLEEFSDYVESGCFIDYDGFGELATESETSDLIILPSCIDGMIISEIYSCWDYENPIIIDESNIDEIKKFTHVVWYNK